MVTVRDLLDIGYNFKLGDVITYQLGSPERIVDEGYLTDINKGEADDYLVLCISDDR